MPKPDLLIVRRALATSPREIRHRLRAWLATWSWPVDDVDDIVAAVDEAVSNVVDHAYRAGPGPGDVQVHAWIAPLAEAHRVVVSVIDRGRWRPVPEQPGFRGRGLQVMDACMAALHIEHSPGGTAVTMESALVPAPRPVG